MSSLILWIDTHEAKIFNLTVQGIQTEKVKAPGPRHHAEVHGKNHTIEQTDEEVLYHTLCKRLEKMDSEEYLITGAGPGREHFYNHLEKHHPNLKKNIKGSLRLAPMTDAQLVDEGMRFFRKSHLYDKQ